MAIQLSSTMASNLLALNSITDDLSTTQTRLNTGKAINSAVDNPALYAKAQSYTDRSDKLTSVNQTINTALKNVATASNAIDSISKSFDGLLSTLRDAKTKAVTATTAVNTKGNFYTSPATGATGARGAIVGTAADVGSNDKFQAGDVFAITTQAGSGKPITRFFQAVAYTATAIDNTGRTGEMKDRTTVGNVTTSSKDNTKANALQFNDMSSLAAAIRSAFGNDQFKVDTSFLTNNNVVDNTKMQLNLNTNDPTLQFTMTQYIDAPVSGVDPSSNTTFDFSKIFGSATDTDLAKKMDLSDGLTSATLDKIGVGQTTVYGSVAGTGSNAASLETRRLAADAFNRALYAADNIVKDAYIPGFANLLQGNVMKLEMNEVEGDSTQYISLGSSINMIGLGFKGYTSSLTNNAFTISSAATINNFSKDEDIELAINQVTAAMTTLRSRANSLDSITSNIQSRLDFNKDQATLLSSGATEITASDAKQDAANLAAIQNRQAFAMNNLAITKQNEQGLIQLLR